MTANAAYYTGLSIVFGRDAPLLALRGGLESRETDRYGEKITIVFYDGSVLTGRISKRHNFTGTLASKTGVKKYHSFRSYSQK